ncbi:MAG: hypothetical protein QHI48_06465 [Bacteroidota bacterium]|nr:hypothetical protein [Bacteroidota bacterium]
MYGYDVGDLDGDTTADLVLTVDAEPAGKSLHVRFFLQRGARMDLVRELERAYLSDPVEVGVSIDDGVCHVARKRAEFSWEIVGYSLKGNVFRQIEHWETYRLAPPYPPGLAVEHTSDRRSNRTVESFYRLGDERVLSRHEGGMVPVFPRRMKLPPLLDDAIADTTPHSLTRGPSSWFGPLDCGLRVTARYDTASITIMVRVNDDRIVRDSAGVEGDRLELWFDPGTEPVITPSGKPRDKAGSSAFGVRISMNGGEQPAILARQAERKSRDERTALFGKVHSTVNTVEAGVWDVSCEIPLRIVRGVSGAKTSRFAACYRDIDSREHPEWVTVIATAEDFDPDIPATYGFLTFFEPGEIPYEWEDFNLLPLVSRMRSAGVIP